VIPLWLRRLPGILWVALFVVASLASAGWAIYARGVRHGEVHVHQQAVADSARTQAARVETVHVHAETEVTAATTARTASDALRAARVAAKQAALGELLATDIPKVTALITLDDSLSARDSVTIAVQAGAIDTLRSEIAARAKLDTLRVNQLAVGVPEPDQHRARYLIGGAMLGAGLVITFLHFAR
jgi:hypothetical protein